jgi:ArsR family transcriptional regulator
MTHVSERAIDAGRVGRAAEIFAVLASPARVAIMEALAQGESSVSELVAMIGGLECVCSAERTNISKHLAVLREAGIVSSRGDGQRKIYRLEAVCLIDAIDCTLDQACFSKAESL